METITITEQKMLELIELYNNALYNFKKSTKELSAINEENSKHPEPIAPSIAEYNEHYQLIEKLQKQREGFKRQVNESETIYRNAQTEILKNLPANKWLKIGKYYVGKRTNDWPNADPEFLIKTEKPTVQITHQIIN